jgi:hypothetical protein
MSEENLTVVRRAYQAFGQNDLPTILELLDPENPCLYTTVYDGSRWSFCPYLRHFPMVS